jgi:hypothetical protein
LNSSNQLSNFEKVSGELEEERRENRGERERERKNGLILEYLNSSFNFDTIGTLKKGFQMVTKERKRDEN